MCAIFGWIDYKGVINSNILNKLTQNLANASEERGTDASGIAYVKDGRITIYKRPKPAHKLKFKVPHGTHAVMGHTRFATQGDKELNYNNHPFFGKANRCFALAHNGVLNNDKSLRKKYELPYTPIETDSYIAVQMIEHAKKINLDVLSEVAEELEGTFNITVLDDKNTIYFVKGSNPLTILNFESIGLYIYASTESILKKALNKTIFKNFSDEKLVLKEGEIISIDKNGSLMQTTYEVKPWYIPKWYNEYYDWYSEEELYEGDVRDLTEDEQNIYFFAEMQGVDSEIISELFEYGYTITEVEELIYEPEELNNIIAMMRGENNYDKTREGQDIKIY